MKRLILASLVSVALAGSATAETLYLPHFEAQADPTKTSTLFAVSNASDTARLVRANFYTPAGELGAVFNFEVPAHGTRTVNLRDTLNGEHTVCPGHWFPVRLDGFLDEDGVARGYIGFDVLDTAACSTVAPGEPGYVTGDATGLYGDWFYIDVPTDFAQGGELIPAPEPGVYEIRFLGRSETIDGTELVVFAPTADGTTPTFVQGFDEEGNPLGVSVNLVGGLRLQRSAKLDVDNDLGPSGRFGKLRFDCRGTPCFLLGIGRAGFIDVTLPATRVE